MMFTDEAAVTLSDVGCWIAGSRYYSADEINAQTIELAERYGRSVDSDISHAISELWSGKGSWCHSPTHGEWLSEDADSAVEWLNDRVAPPGCYFTFDDGLMLYSDDEGDD